MNAHRIYVAGPMTGLPDHNLPAFEAAAAALRAAGRRPVNPGRRGVVPGWTWRDYMRRALHDLVDCDAVALLPGWRNSRGAALERNVAEGLGMDVRPLAAWLEEVPT